MTRVSYLSAEQKNLHQFAELFSRSSLMYIGLFCEFLWMHIGQIIGLFCRISSFL